ncbi:MAG: biotin/lipoyl-binding protein, partial [Faecousia sp.]
MKKLKSKGKKILLSAVALVLVAAIGVGIWFGVKGGAEPVNVYPFNYLGMTEYWGDSHESYGPVTTDKIQTVYLSSTQTVTEILVSEGDEVKQGDVLMTFDTTLTELELERKRLEVEKLKLDLDSAEYQLRKIRNMVPMDPDAMNIDFPEPTEPVLGDEITGSYEISEKTEYDGSAVEKALILWMKDGTPVNDNILREVLLTAQDYQTENAKKLNSSASDIPQVNLLADGEEDDETDEEDGTNNDGGNDNGGGTDNGSGTDGGGEDGKTVESVTLEVTVKCNGQYIETYSLDVTDGAVLEDAYTNQNKTYWLKSAKRGDGTELVSLTVPAYPQDDAAAQSSWKAAWGRGVTLNYIRSVSIRCDKTGEDGLVLLTSGKETSLCFSVYMEDAPKNGTWTWSVTSSAGDGALQATPNGNFLILSGEAGDPGDMASYTVSAVYTFPDSTGGSRVVKAEFSFATLVEREPQMGDPIKDFYMILKVTENDMSRGNRLIWQGLHVYCYEGSQYGFTLFDASSLEDHTLEPLEEEEWELPEIDFGSGYTAAQIAKMRSEQEKTVKEQQLALDMAEAEYRIMQAEVNDGKVCADFDGQVVSVLTEEEARESTRPLLKVSAGGGFYVEGNVSELEKDNLKPGQEVTINDWNTGMTYTGTVESIGDFPVSPSSWS